MSDYDINNPYLDRIEREKKQLRSAMARRGYEVMNLGTNLRPKNLYIHRACGVVVADPDAHDNYCSAKRAPGFLED